MVRFTHSVSRGWIPVIVRPRDDKENEEKGRRWRWKPSYYMLVLAVLILVCMAVSGRVFAICCTSLWWYLLPKLKGDDVCGGNSERTFLKMREYGRRLSGKRLRRRRRGGGGGGALGYPAATEAKGMGGVEE